MRVFLTGVEAIARGALHAGVNLVCGCPISLSNEIMEAAAKINDGNILIEGFETDKAALAAAAAASCSGSRTLVILKQDSLLFVSDPLLSLSYAEIKGGMVLVSADDTDPESSAADKDTRHFAQLAKIPVFDPSSPGEAYSMLKDAFVLSEKYGTPVFLRPAARICKESASVEIDGSNKPAKPKDINTDQKNTPSPTFSYKNYVKREERYPRIGRTLSSYRFNTISGSGPKGIAAGGISYAYTKEALGTADPKLLKITTPHPFPEKLALKFLEHLEEVLVIEEQDPVIERELLILCGKHDLCVKIKGKLTGDIQTAGVNSAALVQAILRQYLALPLVEKEPAPSEEPANPQVLIIGNPPGDVSRKLSVLKVNKDACTGCKRCTRKTGCRALSIKGKKAHIDPSLCIGCAKCARICPHKAIHKGK